MFGLSCGLCAHRYSQGGSGDASLHVCVSADRERVVSGQLRRGDRASGGSAVNARQLLLLHAALLQGRIPVALQGLLAQVASLHTHTHTHTRLTALFPGLPGWASTRKVKTIWILLKQETVSGSGISWAICKSAPCSRQTTTPAPHRSVFTGRMPFLSPNQQRQSTEGVSVIALRLILLAVDVVCCYHLSVCL